MKLKKLLLALVAVCIMFSFTACGKKCENGCGNSANPKCMADMCDSCCHYWMGLNGCYNRH